jgi:hypothetical protein
LNKEVIYFTKFSSAQQQRTEQGKKGEEEALEKVGLEIYFSLSYINHSGKLHFSSTFADILLSVFLLSLLYGLRAPSADCI